MRRPVQGRRPTRLGVAALAATGWLVATPSWADQPADQPADPGAVQVADVLVPGGAPPPAAADAAGGLPPAPPATAVGDGAGAGIAADTETVAREIRRLRALEQSAVEGADTARAEADEHARAMRALQRRMVDAALAIMAQHDGLRAVDDRLSALAADAAAAEAALVDERAQLGRLVAALQRLGRVPREAMLTRPDAPVDTVRAALLLRAAVPALETAAARLEDRLVELSALRQQLGQERATAEALRRDLDEQIAALDRLRREREGRFAEASAEHARLAAESVAAAMRTETLRGLLAELETARARARRLGEEAPGAVPPEVLAAAAPPPVPAFLGGAVPPRTDAPAGADASLPGSADDAGWEIITIALPDSRDGVLLPASGDIVGRFDDADISGAPRQGIDIETYPGAPIVAPLDGEVRYAGPFQDHGDILILVHSDEYHSVIIGAGRLDVVVGQQVLAGEPIAVTPSPQIQDTETLSIYFEFRQNGQPVDPIRGLMTAQTQG